MHKPSCLLVATILLLTVVLLRADDSSAVDFSAEWERDVQNLGVQHPTSEELPRLPWLSAAMEDKDVGFLRRIASQVDRPALALVGILALDAIDREAALTSSRHLVAKLNWDAPATDRLLVPALQLLKHHRQPESFASEMIATSHVASWSRRGLALLLETLHIDDVKAIFEHKQFDTADVILRAYVVDMMIAHKIVSVADVRDKLHAFRRCVGLPQTVYLMNTDGSEPDLAKVVTQALVAKETAKGELILLANRRPALISAVLANPSAAIPEDRRKLVQDILDRVTKEKE